MKWEHSGFWPRYCAGSIPAALATFQEREIMLHVIMCGGSYSHFEKPKALTVVKGEKLVKRTIRLLTEKGVDIDDIKISTNNPGFEDLGVEILHHDNSFKLSYDENGNEKIEGYWLDAFIPLDEPVCYLFGDVFFTEKAIKTIVNNRYLGNTLFGTINTDLKSWNEPLAYKVEDPESFFKGIEEVKSMYDRGECKRHPIVWELYRYLNGIDINKHFMLVETYVHVPDGGMDVDKLDQVKLIEKYYR